MSASNALAVREVARAPLVQAMLALWLVAVVQLVARLPEGILQTKWPSGAAVAAVAALLLLGSLRRLEFAGVTVLLGLAATLAFALQLGIDDPVGAGTIAAAYALVLWQGTSSVLTHPASTKLARTLRLTGGHRGSGGRAVLESAVHRSVFAVCVVVLALTAWVLVTDAARDGLGRPDRWPMLVLAGTFFCLAGWRYRMRAHSHAVLVAVLLGVWLACAWLTAPNARFEQLLLAPGFGLWTVALSLTLGAIARAIERPGNRPNLALARALYSAPLRAFALGLALAVIALQGALAGLSVLSVTNAPEAIVSLLAGAGVLLADQARGRFLWSTAGTAVIGFTLYLVGIGAILPGWQSPGTGDAAHHALVLAALALGLAGTARLLRHWPWLAERYAGALHLVGAVPFAAGSALAAAALAGPTPDSAQLTGAMTLLVVGAFPVLAPLGAATNWRGLLVPVLLSGLVASALAVPEMTLARSGHLALVWGYALWLCGNTLVEPWNRRSPAWSLGATPWPWYGLVCSLAGAATLASAPETIWLGLAGACPYLLLMSRNSTWAGFPWLGVAALTGAGLALAGWWAAPLADGTWQPVSAGTMFVSVAWLNALLAAGPAWRRHGPSVSARFGWRLIELARPLLTCASVALVATLAALVGYLHAWALGAAPAGASAPSLVALGLALAVSFAHANHARPAFIFAHAFLTASAAAAIAIVVVFGEPRHVSLAIALCGIALLAASRAMQGQRRPGPASRAVRSAIAIWTQLVPLAAVGLALWHPASTVPERLAVLALVLVHAAALGWWQQRRRWIALSALLGLALEHAIWLLWVPPGDLLRALPWFALISASNACLALWLTARPERLRARERRVVRAVLSAAVPFVTALSLAELALHGLAVASAVAAGLEPSWLTHADPYAAVAGWLLLAALAVRAAHRRRHGRWIYAAALLGGGAALYLRLVHLGFAPPGVLDTAVLIGAAYVLYAVARLTRSAPTLNVSMALPLIAIATLPAQLGSAHAGAALTAIAVLYLLMRSTSRNPVALYLGVLALNAAVYLWVPLWAERLGVFQLYLVPAAVSVLVLAHLHRRELRPGVRNGVRLAALVTLYCGATLDVFAQPGLAVFVLALALGLISIVAGIALRIRAFLYAGVAFVVLTVGYQLVQLYPEQRLGRAILLIALGVAITGAMIGFNVKREAILERIRIMRADLDAWE